MEQEALLFAEQNGHAAAPVGRGFLHDIALCALDDIPGRRTAVLGGHADCLEAVVLHGQDTAGVEMCIRDSSFKSKPLNNIQQAQFSIGWRFCPVCGHKLYQKNESCSGSIRDVYKRQVHRG